MLGTQEYDGHLSIHDDEMADKLGFAGAPIEGPTHFSQFVHLLEEALGPAVFERGCISAHYQNMVFEGDEVRAFVEPAEREGLRIGAEKKDGTPCAHGDRLWGLSMGRRSSTSGESSCAPRSSSCCSAI